MPSRILPIGASARISLASLALAACVGATPRVQAGLAGLQRVGGPVNFLVGGAFAPGDDSRMFLMERTGAIRILNMAAGTVDPTPFVSINVAAAGEQGLLGLAFHPQYQSNGKFYVYVTQDNPNPDSISSSHVYEYTVSSNPNIANPVGVSLIEWEQTPEVNHKAGWIGFSPNDGMLYVSSGDGGSGYDTGPGHTEPTGNAQDITNNLLGKMLRIDVNGDDFPADPLRNYAIPPDNPLVGEEGDDEIWAYGLRNPYRDSFDRATGDLWIGDVGQDAREEVNFQPADSNGGENYGWRVREGLIPTPNIGGERPPGNVDPVFDYVNGDTENITVIGGYVYRGPDPELQGRYIFCDPGAGFTVETSDRSNYYSFDPADPFGTITNIDSQLAPTGGSPVFPLSFIEDNVGNLYVAFGVTGDIYRIATDALKPGDFNADAEVDDDDLAIWSAHAGQAAGATAAMGDADGDHDVDGADFLAWQRNFGWSSLNVGAPALPAPEPATMSLWAAALGAHAVRRRPRRSS